MEPHNAVSAEDASQLRDPDRPFLPGSWLDGGGATLDSNGIIVAANDPFCTWLEKPAASLVGQSYWDTLSALSPEWAQSLKALRTSTVPFESTSIKMPCEVAEGSPALQWFNLEIARGPQNSFARLSSVLPPLSDLEEGIWDEHLHSDAARRDMFVRLLRAEARLEGLTRRWPCVIFSQRADFSLQFASPNIKDLTGIEAQEWAVQPGRFWDMVHEGDAGELQQQFKRAAKTGAPITNTYRIRHAGTGRVAYILEHRQPAVTKGGLLLGYEVVWLDVTRQTIAEKRLSTAAWKETLAVLTLGMAHDFTNIIAGIHSLSESFISTLEPVHPFYEGLSLIKKSSLQASQLVQRMINLHLGKTGERNFHNLNDVANDLVELVTKILKRRILIETELAPIPLPVYLDVVEFRQVVINLMLNAAEAMPQGGCLTLRTLRHDTIPVVEHVRGTMPAIPCVSMSIQDTGTGIKQRHLPHIFDAFFTTKSKGSGLGLYNARLAIEKHQGAISVVSKEGLGTSFQIWLPEANLSDPSRNEQDALRLNQARRSLLLIGPDGDVFDKTAELLRSDNYHIVTATGADNLAELLHSTDYQFNGVLILAEPNEPVMSLPAELRQQKRDLKVVLKLSGCSQDEMGGDVQRGVDMILGPDLSEKDMLLKLRAFFDQRP